MEGYVCLNCGAADYTGKKPNVMGCRYSMLHTWVPTRRNTLWRCSECDMEVTTADEHEPGAFWPAECPMGGPHNWEKATW